MKELLEKKNGFWTLLVSVKPGSSRNTVEVVDGRVIVRTVKPPADGKANKAVIELIAGYFKVPKSLVTIMRGQRSRDKYIAIKTDRTLSL